MVQETIVALATPPMMGALAIVRMSGNKSLDILSKIISFNIEKIEPRKAYNFKLYKDGKSKSEAIDDAVVITYSGPHSFTGEDMVELIVHGSMVIVDELLETLVSYGARLAKGGEFTFRAYLNDKIELLKAEAINDVIIAPTRLSKQIALENLLGKNEITLNDIEEQIKLILANIEVNIDYPEYDFEELTPKSIDHKLDLLIKSVKEIIYNSNSTKLLVNGISVTIVGKPNVGKSTLLNALLGEDKAIVTNIPGTTRDLVEGNVIVDGILYKFLDTAGIRKNPELIEALGIEKSLEKMKSSDIVIYVLDGSKPMDENDKAILDTIKVPYIIVTNKIDLLSDYSDLPGVKISAKSKDVKKVFAALKEQLKLNVMNPHGFSTARDIGFLKEIENSLMDAKKDSSNNISIDLLAIYFYKALAIIKEMKGEDNIDDVEATIFKHFCVGK